MRFESLNMNNISGKHLSKQLGEYVISMITVLTSSGRSICYFNLQFMKSRNTIGNNKHI